MDERNLRLRLGVVVVAAAVILGILVTRLGDAPSFFGPRKYTLFIDFPQAPGITVDTPVRKSGLMIGRVTHFEFIPDGKGGVRVTTAIDQKYPIYENESCRISNASVLGDSVLEFVNARPRIAADRPLEDGTVIEDGRVVGNPLEILSDVKDQMIVAIVSFDSAVKDVQTAAQNLSTTLTNNSDQVPRIMTKLEGALDQFRTSLASVDDVFNDPELRGRLRESLKELPDLLKSAKSAVTSADKVFGEFEGVGKRVNEIADNLDRITRPFGENADQLAEDFQSSVASAKELLENLAEFSDGLNSREGTLGRLLHEQELYDRLDRTFANVEDITMRLRPIIDDVRIITDKVARDPSGSIGLRSVFDKRPIGASFKRPAPMFQTSYYNDDIHDGAY